MRWIERIATFACVSMLSAPALSSDVKVSPGAVCEPPPGASYLRFAFLQLSNATAAGQFVACPIWRDEVTQSLSELNVSVANTRANDTCQLVSRSQYGSVVDQDARVIPSSGQHEVTFDTGVDDPGSLGTYVLKCTLGANSAILGFRYKEGA
jgi:hypothetical protein